jgi:glycosyltransferase involved in cell wall biosynthesis
MSSNSKDIRIGDSRAEAPCGRPHNILVLENEFEVGGLERILYEIFSRVDGAHFDVRVCCLKAGGFFKGAWVNLGTPFYDGLMRHKYDLVGYRRLEKILVAEKIDLIYTLAHPNTMLFSWLAKRTGCVKKVVVAIHGSGGPRGGRLIKSYQKPFLGTVDRFIAVAHAHKRHLVESEGLDASKIDVIHNGVDINKFRPGRSDETLRMKLGIQPDDRVVTTVASLNPYKCIDELLRAAARIVAERDGVRFLIVGDGPERSNLMKLGRELGLGDKVIFTGVVEDVDEILRLSDMFVLASRTEAFPVAILEAMATALPVVATDVGSVGELVIDGETGWVVPAMDADALYNAMRSLLADRDGAARFGTAGRRVVETRFTVEGMCGKQERLLGDLLCRSS